MARAREQVEHFADAALPRIGQVKALPVLPRQVREVIHGRDDIVDRHEVDVAALEADERQPRRQGLPQLLDHLEEVVRPVDLVDLARLRVADHDARAIDAPGSVAPVADERLRFVLRAEVRMLEAGRLLEHVFAEAALVEPCRRDRAHEVEAPGLHALRELQGVVGAHDVRVVLFLAAGLQVIHGREVEHVVDLAGELPEVGLRHAEVAPREVARDGHGAARARAPELAHRLEFLHGLRPHEHVHALAACQQSFHEVAADESGRAGDEIRHVLYCNPMTGETERMSAVDAAWLRMDRPTNLMVIVGVVVFGSRIGFRQFRRTIEERFLRFPRFRCRARQDAMSASWEPDPEFDLDAHVIRAALPAPAGQAEIEAFVSELAGTDLDRRRPMWQFHFIDDFQGGSAAVLRIHHCYADGMAMIRVFLTLTDPAPDQRSAGISPAGR